MTRQVEYNPLMIADSYKYSHARSYPPQTTYMMSYIEPRLGGVYDKVFMSGLLYYLRKYLSQPAKEEDLLEFLSYAPLHGIPDLVGEVALRKMLKKYKGYFPVLIRAVPEGTRVDAGNVLVTIESTDPEFFWVPSFLETLLLKIWYPIGVATISGDIKRIGLEYLRKTSTDPDGKIGFFLNDFGMRGGSSPETVGIGGMSHLQFFMGSDNTEGIRYARTYLNFPGMPAFSIPALEHSVVSSWGRENEANCYLHFFETWKAEAYPLLACVADTYDYKHTVEEIWCKQLKDMVIASGKKLVIRPDSGDPVKLIPWTLKKLEEAYGYTTNDLGYKVINNVGVIQGDGVNAKTIEKILQVITNDENKYSAENIVFGMGGDLLQNHNRDTNRFAQKCCAVEVDGIVQEVRKTPKTDPTKNSKGGLLELVLHPDGIYRTYRRDQLVGKTSALVDFYRNGEILVNDTLEDIRERVNKQF
jgi:nicotinamide phosphoribosyltransferase